MTQSTPQKLLLILVFSFQMTLMAQYRVYHRVGDTLKYYGAVLKDSKKIDKWYVIDSVYFQNKVRMHAARQFLLDTISGEFKLRQKLNSPYFNTVSRFGLNTFYGVNGLKTAEGERKKSQKIGLWKYWYPDGSPKLERYHQQYKDPLSTAPQESYIVNSWNAKGVQMVKNGTGEHIDINEEGEVLKGYMFENKKDSIWSFTSKEGEKQYEEIYQKGTLIKGTSWDENGREYTYNKVYIKPEFKGGKPEFVRMIQKHFKVPKYASENGIGGYMIVRFDIDTIGKVQDIRVIKKLCDPCDQAAIDVVKKLDKWNPAVYRGKKIKAKYSLPLVIKYK